MKITKDYLDKCSKALMQRDINQHLIFTTVNEASGLLDELKLSGISYATATPNAGIICSVTINGIRFHLIDIEDF